MCRGVVKAVGRRELMKLIILPITKIFDKIYTCNLVYRLELKFSYLSCQKSLKIACFHDLLAENRFLPILCVYILGLKC